MSAKEQLARERAAWSREKDAQQRHVRAVQAELERARRLKDIRLRELQARLGSPIIDELVIALHDLTEASDPLTGAPVEDTMRVNHPTSKLSGDGKTTAEGAATRRRRTDIERVVRRLRRIVRDIESEVGGGPAHTDHRRYAAHVRWHTDSPSRSCDFCDA